MKADALRKKLNKELGAKYKGEAPRVSLASDLAAPTYLPLGSLLFDFVLAPRGGLPLGMLTEFFGPPGSGKTTLALLFAARCQQQGGVVVLVDLEQTFDREYAESLGVNSDDLIIISPPGDAQGYEKALRTVVSVLEDAAMVIVDSIGAAVPSKISEKESWETTIAPRATMYSRLLPLFLSPAKKYNPAVIFINQVRTDISSWGSPQKAPGGHQHDHLLAFQVRVDRKKNTALDVKDPMTGDNLAGGYTMILTVKKSKTGAREGQRIELDFLLPVAGQQAGLDSTRELFILGLRTGLLTKKGNTYYYGEEKLAVGQQAVLDYLRTTPESVAVLQQKLIPLLEGNSTMLEYTDSDVEENEGEKDV